MALIAEYRLLSAPRFSDSERDARLYDSLVSQRALWNHLALHVVRDHGATAELRLAQVDGAVRVSLRIHGDRSAQLDNRIGQMEALLPAEFRWRRAPPDTSLDGRMLRMARIVRRLEYVDLPTPMSSEQWGGPSGGPRPLPEPELYAAGVRELPGAETTHSEFLNQLFCLPLPGPLDELKPRAKVLFQELQGAGAAIVSICIHPMAASDRPRCQRQALNWKRFIDPLAGELASAGFATVQHLRRIYDRFTLPPGYLVHASIRVGGERDEAVVGLANVVATSLGGVRAFQVFPPTRDVAAEALYDPARDVPSLMSQGALAAQRRGVLANLTDAGVRPVNDPEQLDFMLLTPHLFTLEEAGELMRLPTADDEGLPGLDTELIPPFSTPSLRFLPASGPEAPVAPPPPGRLRIGMVRNPGSANASAEQDRFANFAWHTLDPIDLTKHALIVGSTGSGKTMTTLFLVLELHRLGVPLTVIEPVKTEYYQRLQPYVPGLKRWRFEGGPRGGPGPGFLVFDPLRVPAGITVARHCSYVKSCFEAAFPMSEFLAMLLENGLAEYYTAPVEVGGCGLSKFTRGGPQIGRISGAKGVERVYPSFATFKDYLLDTFLEREFANSGGGGRNNNLAQEMRDVFRRRMVSLGDSVLGESFKLADQLYIACRNTPDAAHAYDPLRKNVLTGQVVVELDAIPDADQKALVMAFLLTYLFEHRQAEDLMAREGGAALAAGLRHFLIVEEAHRLLASGGGGGRGEDVVGESSQAKAVGLFVDMLAEIRAYGQGLAIVEQIPTKIASEAVKNTNLKIMLRLAAKDDREYLGEAMNFTEPQMRFVTNLKVERPRPENDQRGQINFVVFDEGLEQPLLLSLPLPDPTAPRPDPKPWLYDEFFERKEAR